VVYIVTAFIILCIIIALAYFVKPSTHTKQPTKAPVKRKIFQKRDYFFRSAKERSLYIKLLSIVDKTQYAVFSQVRLADLVRTPFKGSGYDKVYLKTLPYHVDFVICRKPEYKIYLAIELDGPHHSTAKQIERDIFKSRVLEEAGIPLIRFRVEENLTTETIQNRIRSYIGGKEQA
jgi:hypothetical protein